MAHPDNLIQVGRIGAAVGLKGEVKVTPPSAADTIMSYDVFQTDTGQTLTVDNRRLAKGTAHIRFAEMPDRTAAEGLKGQTLFVQRDSLPELDVDEVLVDDLIGLRVLMPDEQPIGKITAVHNFGAGDVLEIGGRPNNQDDVLVPYHRDYVSEPDMTAGTITITPAPGLLD